ncbi:MAG TPA: riboflavin synthase [Moorella mulderi]|nr:riboflavin synthase [Moorella mulderi]
MFTGLVQELGVIQRIEKRGEGARLAIKAHKILPEIRIGDSLAVNGACLTVVEKGPDHVQAEVMAETLRVTTLGALRPGDRVNLEPALKLGDPLGGHLVTGHVDGVGEIKGKKRVGWAWEVSISFPPPLAPYLAPKGSVAVDGVSLTIIQVEEGRFTVGLIPHTAQNTTLGFRVIGDKVNLEVDIIARYLERLLSFREGASPGLSREFLAHHGFI